MRIEKTTTQHKLLYKSKLRTGIANVRTKSTTLLCEILVSFPVGKIDVEIGSTKDEILSEIIILLLFN